MSVSLLEAGVDSFAYMRDQLTSARGLGCLLARLNLEPGRVQAYVPEDLPSSVEDYRNGALCDEAQEVEAVTALAEHLVKSKGLTSRADLALIGQFAEGAREASDEMRSIEAKQNQYRIAWLTDAKPEYYNGELWYVDSSADAQAVEVLLRELLWFPAVAVLTSVNGLDCVNGEIKFEALWEIIRTPEAVLVGGWDAMNYLMWTPGPTTA